MEGIMSLFDLDHHEESLIAAAAVTVLVGGTDAVEMVRLRRRGVSLRDIAGQFRTNHMQVARRIEVAEHKCEQVRVMLDGMLSTAGTRQGGWGHGSSPDPAACG